VSLEHAVRDEGLKVKGSLTLIIEFEVWRILFFLCRDERLVWLGQCPLDPLCKAQSDLLVKGGNNECFPRVNVGEFDVINPNLVSKIPYYLPIETYHSVHFQVKPKLDR